MAASFLSILTLNARRPPVGAASPPDVVIASSAGACIATFERCKENAAVVDPQRQSSVEDQLARFSIWAFNMGVFAKPKLSLDHRLREAIGIRHTVVGLLGVLNDLVEQCELCTFLADIGDPLLQIPDRNQRLAGGEFERVLLEIAGELTLLHDLSNTIRQAGRKAQEEKAPKDFVIKDIQGNELEVPLMEAYASNILDRFPDCSEVIRRRLAHTMVLRRKRILYRRFRYAGKPIRPTQPSTKPTVRPPQDRAPVTESRTRVREARFETTTKVTSKVAESVAQSTAIRSATTLAMTAFREAQAPTVVSRSKTIAINSHEGLVFPPAPGKHIRDRYKQLKLKQEEDLERRLGRVAARHARDEKSKKNTRGFLDELLAKERQRSLRELEILWHNCNESVVEVICPFCLCVLTSTDVNRDEAWREHVKNDLDAYVCLFEECGEPDKLWRRSEAWLKHMTEHTLRWRCPAKAHRDQHFETQDAFRAHLLEGHKKAYSDAELAMLISRSRKATRPLFISCPLCGHTTEEVNGKLEQHIAGHLRSLALKSLPPEYDDADNEDEDGASNQGSFDALSNRSTIKAVDDMGEPLVFDDQDEVHEPQTTGAFVSSNDKTTQRLVNADIRPLTYTAEDFHQGVEKENEAWTLSSTYFDRLLVPNYLDLYQLDQTNPARPVYVDHTYPTAGSPLSDLDSWLVATNHDKAFENLPAPLGTESAYMYDTAGLGDWANYDKEFHEPWDAVTGYRDSEWPTRPPLIGLGLEPPARNAQPLPEHPSEHTRVSPCSNETLVNMPPIYVSAATPPPPVAWDADSFPFEPHTHDFVISGLTHNARADDKLRKLMQRVVAKEAREHEWDEFQDTLGLVIDQHYSGSDPEELAASALLNELKKSAEENTAIAKSQARAGPSRLEGEELERPDHPAILCRGCSKRFGSPEELNAHVAAEHGGIVKRYICRDPETVGLGSSLRCETPLSNCQSCASKKHYTRWLSAGAHLASCHLERPGPSSGKDKSVSNDVRGAKAGGSEDVSVDLQTVSELKLWLEEVYVTVDGDVLEPIVAARRSLAALEQERSAGGPLNTVLPLEQHSGANPAYWGGP
ncbi:hypothetical protein Purlil1_11404 [Purpureocillium lilacinum]|uniref:C2H2-type domain-containing protein n=1 Tax=Purpureocillium lilacinum TaxID=33203 RepID=A0ABR0BJZ8_PURLI|nr:hypothetical protein Purlil1_11404 [Purpureocillium lilacinum]